jgi:hypothetical protein
MVYDGENWNPASPPILPELGLFEFTWRPVPSAYLEIGRLWFQDPLGIIVAGLFDGLNGSVVLGKARLSGGAFYTGFQYKGSAKIIMSSGDAQNYFLPFDYADMDTYFATRRLLVQAGAEFNGLTPRTTLTVNALGQIDVNPAALTGESALHTQYLTIRYTFMPLETLTLTGAVIGGLAENQMKDIYAHFAATGGMDWEVPGALQDMLQMSVHWSNGAVNERIIPFAPLTSIARGQVFNPKLSGVMIARAKYTARPHRTFSASMEGSYFFRTDGETLVRGEYPPSDSRLLGGELYGTLQWVPTEDLMITIGGGAFFPGWGDVFVPDSPVRWKASAGFIFSL